MTWSTSLPYVGLLVSTLALLAIGLGRRALATGDSIPATFVLTSTPCILCASNALTRLGMRPCYVILRDVTRRFQVLKIGRATKLNIVAIVFWHHLPAAITLLLRTACLAWLLRTRSLEERGGAIPQPSSP